MLENKINNSLNKENLSQKNFGDKVPYDYQIEAINSVVQGLREADRGQLIMPCGTGKTLISLWIYEQFNPQRALILFPSLALLRKTKDEWKLNQKQFTPHFCVCSEQDIDMSNDNLRISIADLGGNVSTNTQQIKEFLCENENSIIYSTYQSLSSIAEALMDTGILFDLAICDEAHKTAGLGKSPFKAIHDDSYIPIKKRLYMTATPRIISEDHTSIKSYDNFHYIADMSDPRVFGDIFHKMDFREAIDRGILVDYEIVAIGITEEEIWDITKKANIFTDETTSEEIICNYAVDRFMKEYNANCVITFHSSVRKASNFKERHQKLFTDVQSFHVNGKQTTSERDVILKEFASSQRSLVTNARCLTEGVDIPVVDGVFFCDPKNSHIDIIQALGRALRRADNSYKEIGYVVVPLFHSKGSDIQQEIEDSSFKHLMKVLRSLSNHDSSLTQRISDFKDRFMRSGGVGSSPIDSSESFIKVMTLDGKLTDYLFTETVNKYIASKIREPLASFEECKNYARGLNLKTIAEWRVLHKAADIPTRYPAWPDDAYRGKGWISTADFLGIEKEPFVSFEECRDYARGLNLKTMTEWRDLHKNGTIRSKYPLYPHQLYMHKGWLSTVDFLGISKKPRRAPWAPYEEVSQYARSLNFTRLEDWYQLSRDGKLPIDYPRNPDQAYRGRGWISAVEFLGLNKKSIKQAWAPFEEVREFAQSLELSYMKEWQQLHREGKLPLNYPSNPFHAYADNGWVSVPDFLGTHKKSRKEQWAPYEEVSQYARSLNLKLFKAWTQLARAGKLPNNYPAEPKRVYKGKGWISAVDFLGLNKKSRAEQWAPFEEARAFARSLNLSYIKEWRKLHDEGKVPLNYPKIPDQAYRGKGWVCAVDFLGTHKKSPKTSWAPFEEVREFARKQNFKSRREWQILHKKGMMPVNYPVDPYLIYKTKGWISAEDFFGINRKPRKEPWAPFEEVRDFARGLRLQLMSDWYRLYEEGKLPKNYPYGPAKVYKGKGWISAADFLGRVKRPSVSSVSFEECRDYARGLNLKTMTEWRVLYRAGGLPKRYPLWPDDAYRGKGWISTADFLGSESKK